MKGSTNPLCLVLLLHTDDERLTLFSKNCRYCCFLVSGLISSTGVDIDSRQKAYGQRFRSFDRRIRSYIKFAKKLHGFNELSKEDQEYVFKCECFAIFVQVVSQVAGANFWYLFA